MQLIDENYQGIDLEKMDNQDFWRHFFIYDVNDADFYLKRNMYWYELESDFEWYTLKMGNSIVRLPSVVYIMLADIYSKDVDWVRVNEIHGRRLTVPVYYSDLKPDQFSIEDIELVKIESSDQNISLPASKELIPVKTDKDRMIFISEKDSYVKTKKMNFAYLY